MKLAYFGTNVFPVNLNRFMLFANHFNFAVIDKLIINKISKQEKIDFLITDSCNLSELYNLWRWSFGKKNIRFIVWALELYNVSHKALIGDYISTGKYNKIHYWLYSLIKNCLPKIFLLRSLVSKNNGALIISSQPRLEYIKRGLGKKVNFIVIKNKPVSVIMKPDATSLIKMLPDEIVQIITGSRYLFIPGQIYNFDDFKKVCGYAYNNRIKIITATNAHVDLSKITKSYPETIHNVGSLSNDIVQALIINCLAGICLYKNNNVNERLSASSKLFEFLVYNKKIIVSKNPGVNYELIDYPTNKIIYVDAIEQCMLSHEEIHIQPQYLCSNELNSLTLFQNENNRTEIVNYNELYKD